MHGQLAAIANFSSPLAVRRGHTGRSGRFGRFGHAADNGHSIQINHLAIGTLSA
jgi:hypothetical protein